MFVFPNGSLCIFLVSLRFWYCSLYLGNCAHSFFLILHLLFVCSLSVYFFFSLLQPFCLFLFNVLSTLCEPLCIVSCLSVYLGITSSVQLHLGICASAHTKTLCFFHSFEGIYQSYLGLSACLCSIMCLSVYLYLLFLSIFIYTSFYRTSFYLSFLFLSLCALFIYRIYHNCLSFYLCSFCMPACLCNICLFFTLSNYQFFSLSLRQSFIPNDPSHEQNLYPN